MNRKTIRLAGVVSMVALSLTAVQSTADADKANSACGRQAVDPQYLPHTADAIQAWFDQCRRSGTGGSVPATADAAQAWLD
jgi:hypothetical protein